MTVASWLRPLKAKLSRNAPHRPARKRPARRLRLEPLEDRTVPATVSGSPGNDTFRLSGNGPYTVTVDLDSNGIDDLINVSLANGDVLDGLGGSDTLIGPNVNTTWDGSVNGIVGYTGIENLKGGTKPDTFTFHRMSGEFHGLSGEIDGGGGTDNLVFVEDDGPWGGFRVDLQDSRVTANTGETAVGSFTNVERVEMVGADGSTLVGPNQETIWSITSPGAVTVGTMTFAGFANLAGGTGNDTFSLGSASSVSGTITGGGGTDKLDYSAATADVVVNLTTGQADRTGGVSGFVNVTGGSGNDILIGTAAANTLVGGNGNNILLGGGGNDTLTGGTGADILIGGSGADSLSGAGRGDILIGGYLSYFDESTGTADLIALDALRAEWTRTDLTGGPKSKYALRIAHLDGSNPTGGLNGAYRLDATTVSDDGVIDSFNGGHGYDWFFVGAGEVANSTSSEQVVTVP